MMKIAMSGTHDEFCTTREASQMLDISVRTAQLWVESGVLRAWKTAGGHRKILRSSVAAILKARREAVAGTDEAPSPERFTVVVVEDEPDLLRLYQLTLANWQPPVRVVTAINGFEGLIRVGENKPDLLLTDLNMPGMDGFRMVRILRASPEFRHMEIVVVTALSRSDIADRGGLPPDVAIFTKPAPFSQLEQIVQRKRGHAAMQAAP